MILQDHNFEIRAIAYASRSLTDTETRYTLCWKGITHGCMGLWEFCQIPERYTCWLQAIDPYQQQQGHWYHTDSLPATVATFHEIKMTAESILGKLLAVIDPLSWKPNVPALLTTEDDIKAVTDHTLINPRFNNRIHKFSLVFTTAAKSLQHWHTSYKS